MAKCNMQFIAEKQRSQLEQHTNIHVSVNTQQEKAKPRNEKF